jgi:alpha-L-rhamnosidase
VLGLPPEQWRPYQVIADGARTAWQREFIRPDGTLAVATQASHVRALDGHLGTAYELLRQDTPPSWLTMVDRGGTTVWEQWEGVDSRGVPHGSLNHYSTGAVATFLHRYVAGLRPTEPGYRTFEFRPQPGGGLTWATTRHLSPYGSIEVSWRLADRSVELDVLVPGGTAATVVWPGGEPHRVSPGRHRWTAPTG